MKSKQKVQLIVKDLYILVMLEKLIQKEI